MSRFRCIVSALTLTWWLVGLQAQAASPPSFTASLDRENISLGELAVLTLNFTNLSPTAVPNLPSVPGLNIQFRGKSSNTVMEPGQVTSVISLNYAVAPSREGEFTIPALVAKVGAQTFSTQPLTLRVQKRAIAPGAAAPLGFVKLIVPRTNLFIGQTVSAEIQLFLQNPQDVRMPELEATGFTLGQAIQQPQSRTQIGNEIYNVLVFRMAATPVKHGALTLGPVKCTVAVRLPPPPTRQRDLFLEFFGGGEIRQLILTSDPVQIQVSPLPEGQPPAFNGAVGKYAMTVQAAPTNVMAGDPVTLKVQISGAGGLDAIPFPNQSDWKLFKTYPPASKSEPSDPLGLTGVKTFEQVIIPEAPTLTEIPPLTFSFFDPEAKRYQTLSNAPIPLRVQPSPNAPPSPATVKAPAGDPEPPPANDIVHIKPHLGSLGQTQPALIQRTWFVLLNTLPLLGFIAALVWRKREEMFQRNPRLRRKLQTKKSLHASLAQLSILASENKGEEFFGTLFRVLQDAVGLVLNAPGSGITEEVVEEKLLPRGLPQSLLADLHRLFQQCNLARYAANYSAQELSELIPTVERVARDLEKFAD